MYVKDRSNRIVTTVGQKNKLEPPTEFKLYLRNLKHSWGRVLYTERQRDFRNWIHVRQDQLSAWIISYFERVL